MAKRAPLTFQEERLQRLVRNAELKIVALQGMIDTAQRIVSAESLEVGTPSQTIELSAGGSLDLGSESPIRVIGAITTGVSHTGDTAETEVGKITLPANSLGPNGFVMVEVLFLADGGGAGNRTLRVFFGGTKILNYVNSSATVMLRTGTFYVWNKGATNSQEGGAINNPFSHIRTAESANTMAIDTTADVDITFTLQNSNAAFSSRIRFALVEAFFQD